MSRRRRFTRWLAGGAAVGFLVPVYGYLTLPDVRPLAAGNPTTTAFMELRTRQAHAAGREPRRVHRWVPGGRISAHLKRAVVVTEDAAFWGHEGVDYHELRASIALNLEQRQFVRGASTITQQLAKNLYLSPSRNPVRKLRELIIARRLEAELTKARILELYLNLIEWGDGIYGAEAAAQAYFGIPAAALSPAQSAMLAGSIINPRAMNPARPTPRLLARQRLILRRMGARPATAPSPPREPPSSDDSPL
jgi:monofunctional glycosyltransferase